MRRQVVTVTGTGASTPIQIDTYISPCNSGIAVSISATATYTVQITFDDIFAKNYNPATGTWFNSTDTNVVNATASALSNLTIPVAAVRLNVTASTGSVTMTVIQAGPN